MAQRKLCLGWELMTLTDVAEAGRILAEAARNHSHESEHDASVTPAAVSALLSLLGSRLEALRKVVQGSADPRHLLAAHNAIDVQPDDPAVDDILLSWDDEKRREHIKAELGQAERRLREARPARKAKRKGTRKRGAA